MPIIAACGTSHLKSRTNKWRHGFLTPCLLRVDAIYDTSIALYCMKSTPQETVYSLVHASKYVDVCKRVVVDDAACLPPPFPRPATGKRRAVCNRTAPRLQMPMPNYCYQSALHSKFCTGCSHWSILFLLPLACRLGLRRAGGQVRRHPFHVRPAHGVREHEGGREARGRG